MNFSYWKCIKGNTSHLGRDPFIENFYCKFHSFTLIRFPVPLIHNCRSLFSIFILPFEILPILAKSCYRNNLQNLTKLPWRKLYFHSNHISVFNRVVYQWMRYDLPIISYCLTWLIERPPLDINPTGNESSKLTLAQVSIKQPTFSLSIICHFLYSWKM